MFTRSNKIISNKEELGNYIEGFDIYNSLFLSKLFDPNLPRVSYRITKFEMRPDLMAEEFYGSTDYTAIFLLASGKKARELKIGEVLSLPTKEAISNIISSL